MAITDGKAAGLVAASLVRLKLFTLDNRFILRRLGQLAGADRKALATALKQLMQT